MFLSLYITQLSLSPNIGVPWKEKAIGKTELRETLRQTDRPIC